MHNHPIHELTNEIVLEHWINLQRIGISVEVAQPIVEETVLLDHVAD